MRASEITAYGVLPERDARPDARFSPGCRKAGPKETGTRAQDERDYATRFCYSFTMTIGITGPEPKIPGRNAVVGLIVTAIIAAVCLILLGLIGDFLVDWMWFSAIGYSQVFWTTVAAKAAVFFVVFATTAVIVWTNARLALGLARRRRVSVGLGLKSAATAMPSNLFEFIRDRLPWPLAIAGGAGLFALIVAWDEVGNWSIILQFLYHVPYGAHDPLFDNDIGFYLFSLPAYIALKNWALLALFASALLAGLTYWVHDDIEYAAQGWSISPTAIAHGSVLLGMLFAVKACSYALDRYLLLYGNNGVVVGAGYTDVHVELPVLWLLVGLSIIAASAAWANLRVLTYRLPAAAIVAAVRRRFPAIRRDPLGVPAILCQTERAGMGAALHPTQHRPHP